MAKIISTYKPRPLQEMMHNSPARFMVAVCHRRFGKTTFAINHIIRKAYSCKRNDPQYMFIAPKKQQAKDVAWKEFKKALRGFPEVTFKEAELRIEIGLSENNSVSILIRGADDPDNLRGLYLDGVVLDEVADMPKSAWTAVLRPALSDRKGWALFIGTPKGKNFFKELYLRGLDTSVKDWASFMFKASETGYIDADELESLKASTDEELYAQEYECSFEAALPGSYYGRLLAKCRVENRIGAFPMSPSEPVITAWDIGLNDKTCIWFAQQVNGKIILFDYYENSGETMKHYIDVVHNKGYKYAYHILPHDAKQRNWSTGNTRLDEMQAAGLTIRVAPKLSIDDGITAVRSILPICHFDETRCDDGLNALSYYHSVYDDKRDVQRLVPEHDWSSHASDAFRYLAITLKPDAKKNNGYVSKSKFAQNETTKVSYSADYDAFGM